MLLLEDEDDYDSLTMEIDTLPEVYHIKLTEYPSNPLEPIREVWEDHAAKSTILFYAKEYPGTSTGKFCVAIQKAMAIVEGK